MLFTFVYKGIFDLLASGELFKLVQYGLLFVVFVQVNRTGKPVFFRHCAGPHTQEGPLDVGCFASSYADLGVLGLQRWIRSGLFAVSVLLFLLVV
jgi:hypothetical protein